jgi:hypothetical protein
MNTKLEEMFDDVRLELEDAHCIAFDGCHKIYLAMDETEATWFKENYEHHLTASPEEMFKTIRKWWDESCSLRFVSAVEHNEADPNSGFTHLIPQGAEFAPDEGGWE